jgi:pantoate--beta-alanine ligase
MVTVSTIEQLRNHTSTWRAQGKSIGFVPTLGNLHAGHLRLVERARALVDKTIVSIYVNPTQFGFAEDLDRYPRTLAQDQYKLKHTGCDLLFTPSNEVLYPFGLERTAKINVTGISQELCGITRPEHFIGVATVVAKLLLIVQANIAVFGEKDRQQLVIVRQLVEDLFIPVQIVSEPTVREIDGLAMSSRNQYLSADERKIAPTLYRVLCWVREQIMAGERDYASLETQAIARLQTAGFQPDYVSIRRLNDLRQPDSESSQRNLVVLAAAVLGAARLIDNMTV